MLNPLKFISKLIKSSNQKELDRIGKIVQKINSLEESTRKLKDSDFPNKTKELKEKLNNGINIDKLLPEAFAICKADMLITGEDDRNIRGPISTLSKDQFSREKF